MKVECRRTVSLQLRFIPKLFEPKRQWTNGFVFLLDKSKSVRHKKSNRSTHWPNGTKYRCIFTRRATRTERQHHAPCCTLIWFEVRTQESNLQTLRFSQRCYWWLDTSAIWRRVVERVVTVVSKERSFQKAVVTSWRRIVIS